MLTDRPGNLHKRRFNLLKDSFFGLLQSTIALQNNNEKIHFLVVIFGFYS